MENIQESGATPKSKRTDLNSGSRACSYKHVLGILLVVSSTVGWMTSSPPPSAIQAAVPLSAPSGTSGVSRHSTLSVDVFQKYVNQNSGRMYPRLSREIVHSAVKYSEKYDLSPILVLAVVAAESEFYPFAVSKKDAKGLMQINLQANLELLIQEGILAEASDIFDPDRNMEAGCFLLRRFINESTDLNAALDKYLGADSIPYKAEIHAVMGRILLLGITEELNKTSQHRIQPIIKVEAMPRERTESKR